MAFWVLLSLACLLTQAAVPPWLQEDGLGETEGARLEMKWPPAREPRSNRVNVTMILTDVHSFDEPGEKITVYAFMRLWWRDTRWRQALQTQVDGFCSSTGGCNASERELAKRWMDDRLNSTIFGQTADSFFESTTGFGRELGLEMNGKVWTPIPPNLMLNTASNPLGKTEFDPIISLTQLETGDLEAFWVDRAKTSFDVSLTYEHFPFDTQHLELCLPFDYFSDPYVQETLEGPNPENPMEIEEFATRWDGASPVSSVASKSFVAKLENLGFSVISIDPTRVDLSRATTSICVKVTVSRRITILILRFFWPLTALLFIPFAGFFIPIDMVMPRVATGFISFLSLQVFRTLAYSMIPKQTSSLLWMDVTMFCVTVIMFASVLENVLAQAMRATVSTYSARFVDEVSRVSFPLVGVVVLTVLFVMGAANIDTTWIMIVALCITCGWLVAFGAAVFLYVRYLPHRLMSILIRQISSSDFRYQKAMVLDQKELALIFRTFDDDGTGDLSAEEVIESFEARGLRFKDQEDEMNFKNRLKQMFRQKAGNRLDLNAFCHHFGELFRYHAVDLDSSPPSPGTAAKEVVHQESFGSSGPQLTYFGV